MANAMAITLVRDTPDLVEAMRKQMPGVHVIDNGSAAPIDIAYLRIPVNRYFAGGFNRALEYIWQAGYAPNYVWMLNSDVSGVSPEMMQDLVDIAEANQVPVVSPRVETSVWPQMKSRVFTLHAFVDWVAPLVNLEWFIRNGGFDERLCGWGSDIDLCFRTRSEPKAIAGHIAIEHPYGTTSKRTGDRKMYDLQDTRRYLISKHGQEIIHFAPSYFGGR